MITAPDIMIHRSRRIRVRSNDLSSSKYPCIIEFREDQAREGILAIIHYPLTRSIEPFSFRSE